MGIGIVQFHLSKKNMAFILESLLYRSAYSATPAVIPEFEPSGGCTGIDFVVQIKVGEPHSTVIFQP